jgi:hypothetical protein
MGSKKHKKHKSDKRDRYEGKLVIDEGSKFYVLVELPGHQTSKAKKFVYYLHNI